MNNFINHLLFRHLEPDTSIKPRTRSRFEPVNNLPGIYFTAALTEQNTPDESLSNFALQDQEQFNSASAGEFATPADQTLPSFPRPPLYNENSTTLHRKEENTFNPVTPSPVVQPAADPITPRAATPLQKEPITTSTEEYLLTTNNENKTTGYFKEHRSAKEDPSPVNQISNSGEPVKPALGKNGTEGSESQSRTGSIPGLLNPSRRLPDFDHSTGLNGNETNRPVIKVTIGRIDVRAVVQSTSSPARSTTTIKPQLSLEDYLKQRNNSR